METNTVVDKIPFIAGGDSYAGGDCHFIFDDNDKKIKKVRYPSDATESSRYEVVETLADEYIEKWWATAYALPISSTHYIYVERDKGAFIRSYEKGAEDEKTALLFTEKN